MDEDTWVQANFAKLLDRSLGQSVSQAHVDSQSTIVLRGRGAEAPSRPRQHG